MISRDTIVAPATPYGHGGIAVVRMSGAEAIQTIMDVCKKSVPFSDRYATLVSLYDTNNNIYDNAMVTVFFSPRSYTGEDVVEVSCHGSPAIVDTFVQECLSRGVRIADPGEFTRRAFLNGKMDLIQAESVASLIHTKSSKTARLHNKILSGSLSDKLLSVRQHLLDAISFVEFELDISEEDLTHDVVKKIKTEIFTSEKVMYQLLESYREGRLINKGASVVITGPPNAGKSTLLNALLDENRSIVNPSPGTTRDVVDAMIVLDGLPIKLSDTAGIRPSDEEIENEGILKAKERISLADFVIEIYDITDNNFPKSKSYPCPSIRVMNKCDLVQNLKYPDIENSNNNSLFISAKEGFGLQGLKEYMIKSLQFSDSTGEGVFLISQRQYQITKDCLGALQRAVNLLNEKIHQYEILSLEIREALNSIDTIFGKTSSEDILNNIFDNFCVGK